MKAILVDDEGLALRDLERQLTKIGGIDIIATFQDVSKALQQITTLKPDVVFLDIDMPEISGLEAAEILHKMDLFIDIVFVTAYEEYALKAFEYEAIDYILKPINLERLSRTVTRLKEHHLIRNTLPIETSIIATVRCFHRLHIEFGKSEPFPWRTVRAQELFAFMVYKRNQPVRKDILLELFWPNIDYKKAFTQLYTTIYQIRKSLESAGLSIRLTNSGSDYYLDLGHNQYDIQVWEDTKSSLPELTPETALSHEEWLHSYLGDYLAEHDYLWAETERQRLRDLWYKHALAVSQAWQQAGKLKEALQVYEWMQKKFPYIDDIYYIIMQFHAETGNAHLVRKKYDQLCLMLHEEYGIQPPLVIQQWMTELNIKE